MKTTLLLLFFTLIFSPISPQPSESTELESPLEELSVSPEEQPLSGWTTLDLSQANADPQIQGLLSIGAQNATQHAVQDGSLPSGTYSVAKVNSIEQNQEVTNVQDYRFDVDVSNEQGVTKTIFFEITYDPAQETSKLGPYFILGQENEQELESETEREETEQELETQQETEQEQGLETEQEQEQALSSVEEEEVQFGFVPVDPTQASTDPQIQGLLQIGVQNATEQAIQNGSLPSGVYQVVQIISVEENLHAENGQEYRFDVNISSGESNATSHLVFEMTYNPSSKSSQVTSYSVLNNQIIAPPSTETFILLNLSAVSSDPQIQGLINIGIQNVTQLAIQNYSLPSGTYSLDQIESVGQGALDPNDYQFNVSIQGNNGTTADISFTLVYNNVSRSTEITSYYITNLVTPQTTETTETTTIYSGLPEGYVPVDMNSYEGTIAYQVGSDGFYSIQESAMTSDELPYLDFYLADINAVGKKEEDGYVYFFFDIYIEGLRLIYIMSYDPTTGGEYVLSYDAY